MLKDCGPKEWVFCLLFLELMMGVLLWRVGADGNAPETLHNSTHDKIEKYFKLSRGGTLKKLDKLIFLNER